VRGELVIDDVETLRARLLGLSGPARTRTLLELGQQLGSRYWRTGPGQPAALPDLDATIAALDEAYGYLDPGDGLRGQVASNLGWMLATRHLAHGGADRDRETGLHLLEEALAFPQLQPVLQATVRVVLGQLYLSRVTAALKSSGFAMTALQSGQPPAEAADADRAAACFREILAGPPVNADVTRVAETMLTLTEAIQTMLGGFGGGLAGFDMTKMMQAMAAMQRIQEQQTRGPAAGAAVLPPMPSFFDADNLARMDPLDRPVSVVDGPEPPRTDVHRPRREAPPAEDPAELRRVLRGRLAPDGDFAALLTPGPPPDDLDDLVALATTIAYDPEPTGLDLLLLAVTLILRDRVDDGDGWGDQNGHPDLRTATDWLAKAARTLLAEDPAEVPLLLRVAVHLDALDRLGEAFADVAVALRRVHADALACGQVLIGTGRLTLAGPALPDRVLVADPAALAPTASTVASYQQFRTLAARDRRPVTEDAVFVADPRGELDSASIEAMLLRRTFYPRSTGLGRTIENIDAVGTPKDVLAHLDASMLYLGCGTGPSGALLLAGGELTPAEIGAHAAPGRTSGGVAVLSTSGRGFVALADALLDAGFLAVVGWRRAVTGPLAATAMFLLHAEMVDRAQEPAAAVRAVREWIRDPERRLPPYAPAGLSTDADPACEGALVHRGV
jgi:hypothetical protein